MMTVLRALGISVGLALLTASSGFSQESTVERIIRIQRLDVAERGWMGLSVRVTLTERTGGPPDARVRILRIVDGGPASLAGIVPGDVIHSIDGQRLTMERWSNFTDDLRPRVRVRLGMDRGRVSREVLLTTATRPSLPPVPEGLTTYLDSVRTSFRTQLESARSRWATRDYVTLLIAGDSVERTSVHILDQTRANAVRHRTRTRPETRERQPESSRDTDGPLARGFSLATGPGGRMTWVMTGDSLERWSLPRTDFVVSSVRPTSRYTSVRSTHSALPLEYLLLSSVAADSVKSAIVQLREQLNDVHEATRRRELEIVQVVPRRTRGTDLADRELDLLKSDDARVTEALSGLAMRLAEIGSVERESRMRAAGGDARATVQWSRPVTAHLVGRNFVGGAQFSDMNPELAAYFGTDRGVLVIQVLSGTPASEAGLMPGDVVTGVGGSDIEDLRSFRDRLNQVYALQRGAVLSLIRRREKLFVTLSR